MDDATAGALLREVARLHGHLQRQTAACCGGTTATQCTILTELGRSGPVTLAELSRRLGLDKGWLSRAVEAMAQEGLLRKEHGAGDLRTVVIALAPAGEARCGELNATLNALAARMMHRIPAADRPGVQRALKLLHLALSDEAAGAATPIELEEAPRR